MAHHPAWRGRGIAARMLRPVERVARSRNCCKLTLEVLAGNAVAMAAYRTFGFRTYELHAETGVAGFWDKDVRCLRQPRRPGEK